MIFDSRNQNGSIVLCAHVEGGDLPTGGIFHRQSFYGYTMREARRIFRATIESNGWRFAD